MSGLNQTEATVQKPPLKILLAAPRGFCAGVDRAIQIVEQALTKFGAPVYVRHEIVHNRYVVDSLRAKGAVFVKELDEIPDTSQPVIFSAHGVGKAIPAAARGRNMFVVDATCPLVSKVHMETARHYEQGREIILVGHRGHPEVVGTLGQLPEGAITLVESVEDARAFTPRDAREARLRHADDFVARRYGRDRRRAEGAFPGHRRPGQRGHLLRDDQPAKRGQGAWRPRIDGLIVVGGPKSSNSLRLVEVAARAGCRFSFLVERAADIPWEKLDGAETVGITAGASAPESYRRRSGRSVPQPL